MHSARIRWAGRIARMVAERGVYTVLVGKPGGKRPLGRTRHRWKDNIKMDFQGSRMRGTDWIVLAQDRDRCAGFCTHENEPSGSTKCGEFLD